MHQLIRSCLRTCPLSGAANGLVATWVEVLDMPRRTTEKLAHAWLNLWGAQ
jgi:hypothetical protein